MKTNLKFLLISIILISTGAIVSSIFHTPPARAAAIWYVAPDGNDFNDCLSESTPCASITTAIDKASNGDTVVVLPGTYSTSTGESFPINLKPGLNLLGSSRDATIIFGQSDQPVLNIGNAVEDFSEATRVEDLTLQNGDIGLQVYSSNYHVSSPSIARICARWNEIGIKMFTSDVYENGATINTLITDSLIVSNTQIGIEMDSYGYFSPSTMEPYIIDTTIQANGSYGILLISRAVGYNGTTIAPHIIRSRITENGNHGIYSYAEYQGHSNPHVEETVIANNSGAGFFWNSDNNYGSTYTYLINTVITGNQEGGVFVGVRSPYDPPSTFHIINCSIHNNSGYGISWQHDNESMDVSVSVTNTIVWNPLADDLVSVGTPWTASDISYSDIQDGDFSGEAGNFSADPLFWDDVHLSSCSPAIDAGTQVEMPSIDIDGQSRPMGSAPDVGADETEQRCILTSGIQASANGGMYGEQISFTIALTPTQVITPVNVILTDTVPSALRLNAESLWASQGSISHSGNTINWTGTIASSEPISIMYNTQIASLNTDVQNYARIDAGNQGRYSTPRVYISIGLARSYIPLINKAYPPRGIYGLVTENGLPAANIQLSLRFYNGSSWSTIAEKYTGWDGSYSFGNVPGLYPGQYYYVRYLNQSYPSRLFTWHTQSIGTYYSGSDFHIGDFDIANVELLLPADYQLVSFPVTFMWTPRPATPWDSYELDLYDPYDGDPYFYTDPPLGYVGSFTLSSRPYGFYDGEPYLWEVWVYSPDGGYGICWDYHVVYFTNQVDAQGSEGQIQPAKLLPDLDRQLQK